MRVNARVLSFIVGGALLSGVFLLLGIREMSREHVAPTPPPAPVSEVEPALVARAARDIAVGETIAGDMVINVAFDPRRHATIATPAELIGKVAVQPIAANALVDRTWVETQSNLAMRVPIGKRAVSIDTNSEIAVAGLLRPGNVVDVQVVYPGADAISGTRLEGRSRTETVLQAVQVLAVGETVLGADGQGGIGSGQAAPARTVTLALTPEEVAAFSLAKNTGVLLLSLRNPGDDSFAPSFALASDYVPRSEPSFLPAPQFPPAGRPVRPRAGAPRRKAEPAGKAELIIAGRRETLVSGGK